jgi:hypothetical protein
MARNQPVIGKLVQSAVERCRERIISSRKKGDAQRSGPQVREESGITSIRKHSHGL